ncbi:albusnodin/ikarugamycin family macrolactam cyclase [Streptomyces sp. NPDC005805]|uniref:albusnodin/ikarugamycin family macrolactam cyclase n=1 Tax=Streptomyces sp. NPDC005805 TaxID=3157068 RepID=UPI00340A8E0C
MPLGGFSTARTDLPHPLGSGIVTRSPATWRFGGAPPVRSAEGHRRRVSVVGLCGATDEQIQDLVAGGVPDCVTWQWPGTYAVLEEHDEHLVIHTDPAAAMPLYAVAWNGTWAWSTSPRMLGSLTGAGVDTERLACAVLAPALPVLAGGRSFFTGVRQLQPGSRVELPADGRALRVTTTWWPAPLVGPAPHARLRTVLTAAVQLRVHADPALSSDLSGGLDSTTLAIVASRSVPAPLNAVTIHPGGVLDGADLRYARLAVGASAGRIRHHLLPLGTDHRPYTRLTEVPATDEPAPSTLTHTRLLAQFRWMHRELGSRSHLTGDGGDSVLFLPPAHLADLVRHRRYGRVLRETLGWARLRRVSPAPLLRAAARMSDTTRRRALAALVSEPERGTPRPENAGHVGWFPASTVPAWATRDAAELVRAAASGRGADLDPLTGLDASVRSLVDEIREVARTAVADVELAAGCGIDLHNPFLDAAVVDTVLRTPLDARPPLYAYKPMLTKAFADLLPPALASRTTKGSFEADHYSGMREALPELLGMADGRLAAMGLIDADRFRDRLRQAAAGVPMPLATTEQALTVEAWLRSVGSAPEPVWVTPVNGRAV